MYSEEKMATFLSLLERFTPNPGVNETNIPHLFTFQETSPHNRCASVYEPALIILGQGKKHCYVDGQKYNYSVGQYLTLFLPMPIEAEVIEASPEKPLLMVAIKLDLVRIANLLLKIDRLPQPTKAQSSSVIFAKPMTNELLDPVIRLLRTLDSPIEQAVLSDLILEEIYFRLICQDHLGQLQELLQHHGQIHPISKVVNYIHKHLDEVVSVKELAEMVNMSTSGFRKTFREVMHMPPLQYAKSIKLNQAQTLLREGKNANEAGYLVGYNSPAQFSREYKRYFGYAPSATVHMT